MVLPLDFHHYFRYFLQQDITRLYITVAIRNLAVGMVAVFSPAYVYLYFGESIPLTMLYFGLMYGVTGLLAVAGGKLIGVLGSSKTMLISSFFLIGYYLSLFSFDTSFVFVPLSIIAAGVAMALFWPGFHTDFVRFSSRETRGKESGRVNVAMLLPTILSPLLGGFILVKFGFPVLFIIVSVVLVAATIPLFYRRQYREEYTDSY
ncbi:MFS transporter, partial [Patescibacteria group bacterium]|nr:MFS transporter [Patescibacteria group bacterium]